MGRPGPKPTAMQAAYDQVADAFTVKKKVVKAPDPLDLNTKTAAPNAEMYATAARLLEKKGNYQAAAAQYQRALKVEPNNSKILLDFAHLYDRQEKYPEAINLYQKVVSRNPKNTKALNDIGLCYFRMGNPEKAAAYLERAVKLAPTDPLYCNNLGSVLVELDRPDEAVQRFASASGQAQAHYNVGVLLYNQDKIALASQHFAQAAALKPDFSEARMMAAKLGAPVQGNTPVGQTVSHQQDTSETPQQPRQPDSVWRPTNAEVEPLR